MTAKRTKPRIRPSLSGKIVALRTQLDEANARLREAHGQIAKYLGAGEPDDGCRTQLSDAIIEQRRLEAELEDARTETSAQRAELYVLRIRLREAAGSLELEMALTATNDEIARRRVAMLKARTTHAGKLQAMTVEAMYDAEQGKPRG